MISRVPRKLFYPWTGRRIAVMSSCSVDQRATKRQSRSSNLLVASSDTRPQRINTNVEFMPLCGNLILREYAELGSQRIDCVGRLARRLSESGDRESTFCAN